MRYLMIFIGLMIALGTGESSTRAQNADNWRVAFYDQGGRTVVLVTSDGVETIQLPDIMFADFPDDIEVSVSSLSPDGRYFLLDFLVVGGSPEPVFIVDVTAPTLSTPFADLPLQSNEYVPFYRSVSRAAFSPDGTEVALSYQT